jgi:hypothetical protein
MGSNLNFQDEIFHFYRFCSLNKIYGWNRMFVYNGPSIKDAFFADTINHLSFHLLINDSHNVTEKGILFLKQQMEVNDEFCEAIDKFLSTYQGEHSTKNSCFYTTEILPVACHLCKNHSCVKVKLKDLIPFKGFKNPYRSIAI